MSEDPEEHRIGISEQGAIGRVEQGDKPYVDGRSGVEWTKRNVVRVQGDVRQRCRCRRRKVSSYFAGVSLSGAISNLRQMRWTVERLRRVALAIMRRLHG